MAAPRADEVLSRLVDPPLDAMEQRDAATEAAQRFRRKPSARFLKES
ncbi:hypothetical protein ACFPJ1_43020 [Kribbella qitaiheensis]